MSHVSSVSAPTAPDTNPGAGTAPPGWRWAPAWVVAFVALWPVPGIAEAVMVLGAVAAIILLLRARSRPGAALLSPQAWALTSVLFFAYWLPEAIGALDALDGRRALREAAVDLRYLPFLWLAAASVGDARGRRVVFGGIGVVALIWTVDALVQSVTGISPLFTGIDAAKLAISGHRLCNAHEYALLDRLGGVLGPCNLKLGVVLATLAPFALFAAASRLGRAGWLATAAAVGAVVLLAGSRASWITFGLVLLLSGWRLLGWKRLLVVFAFGLLSLAVLAVTVPQVGERIERTARALAGDEGSVNSALSGRTRIWGAALCMAREHPVNGVGPRGFRKAFAGCDPTPDVHPEWGIGPALHAHQLVLEVLSETGIVGLLLWLAGAALAWRAWRYASVAAREAARPAMLALAVTVFPFNTHLAFYSTFWGGVTLLLAALYAGSLYGRTAPPAAGPAGT